MAEEASRQALEYLENQGFKQPWLNRKMQFWSSIPLAMHGDYLGEQGSNQEWAILEGARLHPSMGNTMQSKARAKYEEYLEQQGRPTKGNTWRSKAPGKHAEDLEEQVWSYKRAKLGGATLPPKQALGKHWKCLEVGGCTSPWETLNTLD